MNTFVEGSYETIEDTIRAVDTLVMRGHSKDDITLVTADSKREEIKNDSDLKTSSLTEESNHSEVLSDFEQDIKNGNIVILVKENRDESKELSNDMNTREGNIANERSRSGPNTATDQNEESEDVDLGADLSSSDVNPSNSQPNSDIGK